MTELLSKVFIVGDGIISPLGADAKATNAAVKASISAFGESCFYDEKFNPVKMAVVPAEVIAGCLDEAIITRSIYPKHARILALATLALRQLITKVPVDKEMAIFLAGPEGGRVDEPSLDASFLQLLAQQVNIPVNLNESLIFHTGRAGSIDAINMAFNYLASSESDFVLVGGVDTAHDLKTCNYFLDRDRLLTDDVLDGLILGEAAGFLLLSRKPVNGIDNPYLLPPGLSMEQGDMYSSKPCMGKGLTEAAGKAVSYNNGSKIGRIYSSMTGESFFGKELGLMMTRNNQSFSDDVFIEHPADCYGDTGAASGILMISQIIQNLNKAQTSSPSLVCCSSDGSYRGATVVAC